MAIQHRRGEYEKFAPSKMLPGEWAVVQTDDPKAKDGMAVYMAFAAGVVKRMATYEDMRDDLTTAFQEAGGGLVAFYVDTEDGCVYAFYGDMATAIEFSLDGPDLTVELIES